MKTQEYWEQKHPEIIQTYSGRPLPTGKPYDMDVRHFVWADDSEIQQILRECKLIGQSNDETAQNIQKFVVRSILYTPDEAIGRSEYWLFPAETLEMLKGDCEDGAILMASMLLTALPASDSWRVRVAAGIVQAAPTAETGGHAYVTYCRCSDNEWVALDWCYYEDSHISVADKPLIKDVHFYKQTWFSFNHEKAWSNIEFALAGRLK